MILFYNISLWFYRLAIWLTRSFLPKAKLFYDGRKNIFQTIQHQLSTEKRKVIWMHCASLGEFEQGRPIIEALKNQLSEYCILLTFFSPSGYEIRKNYNKADYVFYLPLDNKKNADKFLNIIQPVCTLFVKYEFWHYYLTGLKQRNVPTFIFSAIFQERHIFFKWYGGLYRKMLKCFTHIFVQDEKSKTLLQSIGINNVTIAGDTRFDRVKQIMDEAKFYPSIEKFKDNHQLIVAGSTWEKDDKLLLEALKQLEQYKLIIAPHEIGNGKVKYLKELFSDFETFEWKSEADIIPKTTNVCIINSIGHLAYLYRYADIIWIGGGFNKKGIHNTIEAAFCYKPIFFGTEYSRFKEAMDMVKLKTAFTTNSVKELVTLIQNQQISERSRSIMANYVQTQLGAKNIILKGVIFYLNNKNG